MSTAQQTTAPVKSPPRMVSYRASEAGIAVLALAAEVAILSAVVLNMVPAWLGLVAHGGVVTLLIIWLAMQIRAQRDAGPALLLVPAVAFLGPFGACGGVLIGWFSRRGIEDVERLENWYRRLSLSTELDPTARLADHVITGRAMNFELNPASPMSDLVENGSIGEKQAILGLIARRFHPDYLPTLQVALVSQEPVIRVQAAAVAAKIRSEMPARVERLLRDASDPATPAGTVVTNVREARLCATSGLMEAKDRERTERLIDGLMARTLLRLERGHISNASPVAVRALEDHLLAHRRHGDFRRLRRMQAWARRGPWIWRPLKTSVASQRSVA